jgi:hypothetical protein
MARGSGFAPLVFVESANQVVGGADVQPARRFALLRGFPPYARRCRAATLTLAPLRVARGWPPPLRPRPRRCAAGRGLRRGLAFLAPPSRRGVHGWAPGGTRSLALARLRLGRCPRREDRRGSSRRSAALFRPAGFGWGRARRCGTRQPAASPTPPPIRARATPDSLTRVVQIRLTADFQRRLSVRAFQGHFSGKIGRFGAENGPRASILPKKRPQKALQGRLQLAPSVPLRVKLGATCLTAAYLPGADSGPRPAPSRPRGRVRDWGRGRWALRGMVSQSSRNN